ncbi:cytochrome b/b6 domain-containing protein [Shewanella sp. GXUN23E]|uniref:cytochrome b/b6 domain-containing protein n=1 Tax=Shewanella sp. GXUN23E TaxID=3422498 RepID=UPI003D7D805E
MSDSKLSRGINDLFSGLPPLEKWLHALILTAVILQIISSSFMHIHADTLQNSFGTVDWYHIIVGLGLLLLTPVFMGILLKRRTWRDLYPWLAGNFSVIKEDIGILRTFSLPPSRPAGLAACVEGLGLLALLAAVLSGALWFTSMRQGWTETADLLSLHKTLVGLIETYVYGHGGFALLHFIAWWRKH